MFFNSFFINYYYHTFGLLVVEVVKKWTGCVCTWGNDRKNKIAQEDQ